jgi:hypothetical protein
VVISFPSRQAVVAVDVGAVAPAAIVEAASRIAATMFW